MGTTTRRVLTGLVAVVTLGSIGLATAASLHEATATAQAQETVRDANVPSAGAQPLDRKLRAAFLGDSITQGWTDLSTGQVGDHSWFYGLVSGADAPLTFAAGVAEHGMTTAWMVEHVRDALASQPDLLFVLGGTNDVASGIDPAETMRNLEAIGLAANQAGTRVVYVTLPPFSNPTLDEKGRALSDQIRSLASREGALLVDPSAALRGPDGGWASGLTDDGIHPNPDGVAVMSRVAASQIATST